MTIMDITVEHNKEEQVFYANLGGSVAELAYSIPSDDTINMMHTYVPEEYRGNGIGEKLVEKALAYAKENNYRVIPSCSFVARYVHSQHR
jgi:predicted GNAT family acetyltransferase